MAEAPLLTDHLCEPCEAHFAEVERLLEAARVPYVRNARLVRGLDYYVRTAFEVVAPGLGAQNAVGGGGRYDGLVAALGGPAVGGIGFALGLERVAMASSEPPPARSPEVCVIPLADGAATTAFEVVRSLRGAGARCELEPSGRSLKSAMRRADRLGAHFALLLGDDEIRAGRATLRDLKRQADHRLAVEIASPGPALVEAIRGFGAGELLGG